MLENEDIFHIIDKFEGRHYESNRIEYNFKLRG